MWYEWVGDWLLIGCIDRTGLDRIMRVIGENCVCVRELCVCVCVCECMYVCDSPL